MRVVRMVAVAGLLALAAAACGGDDGSDTKASSTTTGTGAVSTTAGGATTIPPQSGGTLRFAAFAEILGLDPIVAIGFGTSGGNQQGAIYDTLVRYDDTKKEYVNRTAASVTPNADSTEWTVKIKPGIKFTDGTDYDAEAVKFGMNRHRVNTPGAPPCAEMWACPGNNATSGAYMSLVKSIDVVDKLTVKFTLNESWPSFQVALSLEPAMIPSPTALKKCDATKAASTCDFNTNPVGAGPFMVASPMKSGEPLKLVRNPNYWDGPVYLDALEFVTFADSGGSKTYDAFKTGTVQAAYLQDPTVIAEAKAAKTPAISTLTQGGQALIFNFGATVTCAGGKPEPTYTSKPDGPVTTNAPTKELKIRQAVAAAIDPKVVDQRATNGVGQPTNLLFLDSFKWDPKVAGHKVDADAAKRLVQEAKAAGWDGNLKFLTPQTPFATNVGLAVQAILQNVGINVTIDARPGQGWQSSVTGAKDYEMAMWGMAMTQDDSGVWQLISALGSNQTGNRGAFKSTTMDDALKAARLAKNDDEKRAAFKRIAEEFNAQVPLLVYSAREEYRVHTAKVHGIASSHRYIVFFDKAWMEK